MSANQGLGAALDSITQIKTIAARAALDPTLWPDLLWHVGQFIGSDMVTIEHIDKVCEIVEIGFTDRPDIIARTREPYEQYYGPRNPRRLAGHKVGQWAILDDDIVGDDKALDSLEFYADFLRPHNLKYFIGCQLCEDAEHLSIMALHRAPDRGRITEGDRQRFRQIVPTLRNAMAMHLRLKRGPAAATFVSLLDHLAEPIAILRNDGYAVFANRTMRSLIDAQDIVRLQDNKLIGAHDKISRALASSMRRARLAENGLDVTGAAVEHGSGLLILRVLVLLQEHAHQFSTRDDRLFCLFIDDPARPRWMQSHEAMQLFDLSRQEANVGAYLTAGLGVPEIAARLGLSRNTIRTHVAALRDKLGVASALAIAAELRRIISPLA
ncbi:MAG: LuxR C-terminal-related transcriptional regulator [Rhodothalassiaceae bacterium]